MTALQVGYNAAIGAWRDPGAFTQKPNNIGEYYSLLWAYYLDHSPVVYSSSRLQRLKSAERALYIYTRLIFNPVPQIVDFYVDHLYPRDTKILPSGAMLSTPVEDGTDEDLLSAIAQLDQWGNWPSEVLQIVRYGASTGSVGVEIDDRLESEKVVHNTLWPSQVKSVKQDTEGNVKAYILEYQAYDEERKEHYTFRKEVDEEFRYFRDGKLFDPPDKRESMRAGGEDGYRYNDAFEVTAISGRKSTGIYENPYGFVPMVWIKHKDDGSERGLPAAVNLSKVDEINSLVSHRHDHQHKAIEAGKLISTDGNIRAVTGASGESLANQSGGISTVGYDTRTDWMLLKAPNADVSDLGSSFDLLQGDPDVKRLLESFTADYPELQAAKLIEEHGATSGTALMYKLGKAQSKLDQAGAQYNPQIIKLRQMQIAIAGWRTKNGWKRRDAQRAMFSKFDLNSYERGDLNFGLKRALLVQQTELEKEELRAKKLENAKNSEGLYDDETRLELSGITDEEKRKEIMRKLGKVIPTSENEQ